MTTEILRTLVVCFLVVFLSNVTAAESLLLNNEFTLQETETIPISDPIQLEVIDGRLNIGENFSIYTLVELIKNYTQIELHIAQQNITHSLEVVHNPSSTLCSTMFSSSSLHLFHLRDRFGKVAGSITIQEIAIPNYSPPIPRIAIYLIGSNVSSELTSAPKGFHISMDNYFQGSTSNNFILNEVGIENISLGTQQISFTTPKVNSFGQLQYNYKLLRTAILYENFDPWLICESLSRADALLRASIGVSIIATAVINANLNTPPHKLDSLMNCDSSIDGVEAVSTIYSSNSLNAAGGVFKSHFDIMIAYSELSDSNSPSYYNSGCASNVYSSTSLADDLSAWVTFDQQNMNFDDWIPAVFTHEIGHLLGGKHSNAISNKGRGATYKYGLSQCNSHHPTINQFATILYQSPRKQYCYGAVPQFSSSNLNVMHIVDKLPFELIESSLHNSTTRTIGNNVVIDYYYIHLACCQSTSSQLPILNDRIDSVSYKLRTTAPFTHNRTGLASGHLPFSILPLSSMQFGIITFSPPIPSNNVTTQYNSNQGTTTSGVLSNSASIVYRGGWLISNSPHLYNYSFPTQVAQSNYCSPQCDEALIKGGFQGTFGIQLWIDSGNPVTSPQGYHLIRGVAIEWEQG